MQGVTNKTYEVAKHYMSAPFYISSEFGDGRNHRGIDITIPGNVDIGEPIYSFLEGFVKREGYQANGAGNYIVIGQDNGQEQKYMHMHKQSPLKKGDKVKAGDVIGQIGNTGGSSGAHLHLELWENEQRVIDPKPLLLKWSEMHGKQPDYIGHKYQEDIELVKEYGIMHGYPGGDFGPEDDLTRGQFAVTIANMIRNGYIKK